MTTGQKAAAESADGKDFMPAMACVYVADVEKLLSKKYTSSQDVADNMADDLRNYVNKPAQDEREWTPWNFKRDGYNYPPFDDDTLVDVKLHSPDRTFMRVAVGHLMWGPAIVAYRLSDPTPEEKLLKAAEAASLFLLSVSSSPHVSPTFRRIGSLLHETLEAAIKESK